MSALRKFREATSDYLPLIFIGWVVWFTVREYGWVGFILIAVFGAIGWVLFQILMWITGMRSDENVYRERAQELYDALDDIEGAPEDPLRVQAVARVALYGKETS